MSNIYFCLIELKFTQYLHLHKSYKINNGLGAMDKKIQKINPWYVILSCKSNIHFWSPPIVLIDIWTMEIPGEEKQEWNGRKRRQLVLFKIKIIDMHRILYSIL